MKEKLKTINDKLWESAKSLSDKLSEQDYIHIILGILSLKFINDKNEIAIKQLISEGLKENEIDDFDLRSKDAFVVPEISKWKTILTKVGTSEIGQALDDAIFELGKANPQLKGIFSASYNDSSVDKTKLGEVIKIFQSINLVNIENNFLSLIYEDFLSRFFIKKKEEAKKSYTPRSIVKLITLFIEPTKGKIYDPCCGTAGMLVQAKRYIEEINKNVNDVTFYGQEKNESMWKLAKLNLLLNGFNLFNTSESGIQEDVLGKTNGDTFIENIHKDKKFDYIMANPPFNVENYWHESLSGSKWWQKYGEPPKTNSNFAWIQYILYSLTDTGKAGVVLPNGSLTSTIKGEDKIKEKILRDNKVSCIVALPDKLFFTTGISASIWFFDNNKKHENVLMIDAQDLGQLINGSKKNKQFDKNDFDNLIKIFKKFENGENIDIPGLAKSIGLKELEENEFLLSPGRYITISKKEKKDPNEIKKELSQAIDELFKLMDESKKLEQEVREVVKKIKS